MAITLVVNPGSSSKKYALYKDKVLLFSAYVERSANGFEMCTTLNGKQQLCEHLTKNSYKVSLNSFLEWAIDNKVLNSITEISLVAIRIVAPGTYFQSNHKIDEKFLKKLDECVNVAPLHVPHMQSEIKVLISLLPEAKLVAVSDSSFHKNLPDKARLYSLPREDSKNFDIYRFGYHGLSVASVMRRVHAVTGQDPERAIVCHLGSGVSVTALKNGQSVDTTMGYDPGSGLIMGSRAGDLDAGALLAVMQARNLKPIDAYTYMQTQGGMKGLAEESDLRFLLERRAKADMAATTALEMFVYQIQKTIGAYVAVLGGLDTLIFTATAGERSPVLRTLITNQLQCLGILLDEDKNLICLSRDGVISDITSGVKVAVIRSEEAKEILFEGESVLI